MIKIHISNSFKMVVFKNDDYTQTIREIMISNSVENCSNVTLCCSDGKLDSNTLPFLTIGKFWKNILQPITETDIVILIPDFTTSDLQSLMKYVFTSDRKFFTRWIDVKSIFPDIDSVNIESDMNIDNEAKLVTEFKVDNVYTCKFCLKDFLRAEACKNHEETYHLKKKTYNIFL